MKNRKYTVDRAKLLRNLEAVVPGLSKKDTVEQSGSFAFVGKYVWTYNGEIACKAPSGLPEEFEGAIEAQSILSVLRERKDDKFDIELSSGQVVLVGKNWEVELQRTPEITLEVEKVERPGKKDWKPLPDDFGAAINIVQNCARKDGPDARFEFTCIHIHPKWVEACDNQQLTRYRLKSPIKQSLIVRRDNIKHITSLDMTEFAETETWVHFRNPARVHLSCLRHFETFPNLTEFLKVEGKKIVLPRGVANDAKFVEIFSKQVEDRNLAVVTLKPGWMYVRGIGVTGKARTVKKVKYDGKPLAFGIAPKLLQDITKRHNEAQINKQFLRVDGEKWTFVTSLESPKRTEQKATAAAEAAAMEDQEPENDDE